MANNTEKTDQAGLNFVIKWFVCMGLGFLLFIMLFSIIHGAKEQAEMDSLGYRVERLEDSYYNDNYSYLRNKLRNYDYEHDDMDDAVFDVYREMVKAQEDYAAWRTWYLCLGTELDGEAQVKEPELREAVYANAKNCADERNQRRLDRLVEEMEAVMASATGEDE